MKNSIKLKTAAIIAVFSIIAMQSCEKESVPSFSDIEISDVTLTSAVAGVNISYKGGSEITERGVVWSKSANPTTASSKTTEGNGTGVFFTIMTGLDPNTTYFVRAYALNSQGTAYGSEVSFKTEPLQENSAQKSDFPGGPRSAASGFSIGNKLYVGLGSFDDRWTPTKDLWEYDETTGLWSGKADFPGNAAGGAVGFSIGTKGYFVTGATSDGKVSSELWEYDPASDSWTQKESLPGSAARAYATGFTIGSKGYIGTGYTPDNTAGYSGDNIRSDFWEWDQATNTWTEKALVPGNPRTSAAGFSIGTKGYIGTGFYTDGVSGFDNYKDFWEWDQTTDTWTRKADFGGAFRSGAIGFSIGNKGYMGAGTAQSFFQKDIWEYDQDLNAWYRRNDIGGHSRVQAVGISSGSKVYIGLGLGTTFSKLMDFWEYEPE